MPSALSTRDSKRKRHNLRRFWDTNRQLVQVLLLLKMRTVTKLSQKDNLLKNCSVALMSFRNKRSKSMLFKTKLERNKPVSKEKEKHFQDGLTKKFKKQKIFQKPSRNVKKSLKLAVVAS